MLNLKFFFSTDIQSLKEKLLQQVGSKAFLESASAIQANQNKMPKIFQDRKLLTLDFVTDYKEESARDFGPLSCVPVSSQESAIGEAAVNTGAKTKKLR